MLLFDNIACYTYSCSSPSGFRPIAAFEAAASFLRPLRFTCRYHPCFRCCRPQNLRHCYPCHCLPHELLPLDCPLLLRSHQHRHFRFFFPLPSRHRYFRPRFICIAFVCIWRKSKQSLLVAVDCYRCCLVWPLWIPVDCFCCSVSVVAIAVPLRSLRILQFVPVESASEIWMEILETVGVLDFSPFCSLLSTFPSQICPPQIRSDLRLLRCRRPLRREFVAAPHSQCSLSLEFVFLCYWIVELACM